MSHEHFESIAALDALGVASGGDVAALRLHLAACIPCRRARDEYGRVTTMFALALEPSAPPPGTRGQIRSRIAVPSHRLNVWGPATAATAASLMIALLGWRALTDDQNDQRALVARLERENVELAQRADKLSSELAALASAGTRTIALAGQEIAPAASAKVFLQPERRRALVFFYDLPQNSGEKSYQLWIIRADQPKPVSAGVFDVTKSGTASLSIENLPVATEIKALAVTLEPRGGVEQPTNSAFYVAGNADM
jgi:anti-sigma-K factor RskA